MNNYTHLIWDFNGTLYNDVEACIQSANALLTAHNLAPIKDVEHYRSIFGFPIIDYYHRMGFDFEKTPYEKLAMEWVDYYQNLDSANHLYHGIPELLEVARSMGFQQIILSATHLEMLEAQVSRLGIRSYFDELLGLNNIHAHSKLQIAENWRQLHPDAKVLFLGDTDHDAFVADAIGADCILFCSGHQDRFALAKCKYLAIFDTPQHFLRFGAFERLSEASKTENIFQLPIDLI